MSKQRNAEVWALLFSSLTMAIMALWASQVTGDDGIALFFAICSGVFGISGMGIIIKDCNRMMIQAEIEGKRP